MNKMEVENISAFHPGYYISDLINDLEMTQEEFAKRLFRLTQSIDEKVILNSNAWVQTVINIGKQIEIQPYCEKRLKGYLPQIREMTLQNPSEFLPQLSRILSECGVGFVLIPSLKNSGVYGATKWINKDKVVLGITNRGRNADIF